MEPEQREKSSGFKKRVDDGSPPSGPEMVGGSAKPDWDKTTFRVSRIPERLGVEDLSQVLVQMLGVTVSNFSIHSLALDASDVADAPSKTATVSFRAIPALLQGSHDLADYWDFELPAVAAAESGQCRISFDTHFNGFTPLSSADHTSRPVDCIVVPGWGGHALGSFRSSKSPYVWLRDSLPRHCPELRVWTYGYPSHLTDAKSSADLYELAERFRIGLRILRQQTKTADEVKPLIFIAHSLGGWIFKDAMIQMRKSQNEVDQQTVLSTYGALFFGVPTQGMDVEAIANMVQDLPARYISTLLDQKDGFRLRQRQHEDFCQAFDYKDSRIVQFFELEKSPTVIQDPKTKEWSRSGPLALLVNPASATHGRAWEMGSEYTFSLAGNHSSMIKFSNDRDEYRTVRSCLQDFTKQAALVVRNRWKKPSDRPESSDPDHLSSEQQHCLQSLYFSEMHERRNDIEDPANGTCKWLLKNPTYLKWFNQQHGMLWIKGTPGAGKSTLIKYAVGGAEQIRGGDAVLASFFFHGRGAPIQKSIIGLFRSLLHQLLQQLPDLLRKFSSLYKMRTEREGQWGVKWDWHEKELQNFFKVRVAEAARTRTIRLYVDALDESGESTAVELFDFFQHFSSLLAICFSCRHYPLIALKNGLEIRVEDLNGADIDTYIRTSINTSSLAIGDEIAEKSLGSFQWVALVIRLIQRLHRNGKSLAVLRSKIEQLPSELSALYKELLGSLDEEDLSESLLLMQWILFSLRPLKLSELGFALVMGQETSYTSIIEYQSSRWFSSTEEELKRKVVSLSRGLVEVRELQTSLALRGPFNDHDDVDSVASTEAPYVNETSNSEPRVQFIHQSVKDFLLEGGLHLLDRGCLKDAIGRGHSDLARSCIKYINLEDVQHCDFTVPSVFSYDFLSYAARSWRIHLEEAVKRDPPQACLLSMLSMSWDIFMETWIKVSLKLNSYEAQFPHVDWSLLHVASRFNLPSLVDAALGRGVEANLRVQGGRTPLSIGAGAGSEEVVKKLLDRHDVELNSLDNDGRTPLSHAAWFSRKATLTLLLDRENVDPNLRDCFGNSPLSDAIVRSDREIVAILLQRPHVDANCRIRSGMTPISRAIREGAASIVKLLLDRRDVDLNVRDHYGRTPLYCAVAWNLKDILQLLLDHGDVRPNAEDYDGMARLSSAVRFIEEGTSIVKLLLDRRDVDPNVTDYHGRTPLYCAAAWNLKDRLQLLLDREDIDPNAKDHYENSPLSQAAQIQREVLVKLLLDRKDIIVEIKDNNRGRTPLSCAAERGNEAVVKLLLNRRDVDPNIGDYFGRTPLSYAAWDYKDIVQLLLDRDDVDPNVPDIRGRTPLEYATRRGHAEIATMLRDRMRGTGSL